MALRLFLSQSFATEKLDRHGNPDPYGISDLELGDKISDWIDKHSYGQIEVVRTHDPLKSYLSKSVRHGICSSDAVLCLFTMRTKDQLKGKWIPSTYVVSEGSAALMQLPTEDDTHHRLFGLMETGVDPEQRGMAFHTNKVVPEFRRDNLGHLESLVQRVVEEILDFATQPRNDWDYLSIDKSATIRLDGSVIVATRHRFRFVNETEAVSIPHTMWRVSKELPSLEKLIASKPDSKLAFLRAKLIQCGHLDPNRQRCLIKSDTPASWNYERNFVVEFPDIKIQSGDQLEYEIAWSYPQAFHNPPAKGTDNKPNSVGLRTSGRGKVASAAMTLRFERDLQREPDRILEGHPVVSTTHITTLPGGQTPEEFLHNSRTWERFGELRPDVRRSCNLYEAYRWQTGPFQGMAKVVWEPHFNHFHLNQRIRT